MRLFGRKLKFDLRRYEANFGKCENKTAFFVCFQDELVMDLLSFDKEFHLETGCFPHFPSRSTPRTSVFIPFHLSNYYYYYFYIFIRRCIGSFKISKRNGLTFIIRHSLYAFRIESKILFIIIIYFAELLNLSRLN